MEKQWIDPKEGDIYPDGWVWPERGDIYWPPGGGDRGP